MMTTLDLYSYTPVVTPEMSNWDTLPSPKSWVARLEGVHYSHCSGSETTLIWMVFLFIQQYSSRGEQLERGNIQRGKAPSLCTVIAV